MTGSGASYYGFLLVGDTRKEMKEVRMYQDLEIGDLITVIDRTDGKEDNSFKGDKITVLGIAYPYIKVSVKSYGEFVMDLRKYTFGYFPKEWS